MPVDKFGRSGKSNSVITEGVSLSYIGNNFLRIIIIIISLFV